MVNFADIMRKYNGDANNGGSGSGSASGSSGTNSSTNNATNSAMGDARPQNGGEPSGFTGATGSGESGSTTQESKERSVPGEPKAAEGQRQPTAQELAEQETKRVAAMLGLNAVQAANLTFSVGAQVSAGADLQTTVQRDVQKITGIPPEILAMANEAALAAKQAGVGNMQSFTLSGRNFDEGKRIVGEGQQRSQEPAISY